MKLEPTIKKISDMAKSYHGWDLHDIETSGDEYDAMLLIAKYILDKRPDIKIGSYNAKRLIEIFDDGDTGTNDEVYCGCEEEMLLNFIQMCSSPKSHNTLTDDYPVPGKFVVISDMDEDVHMLINYYESLFWPDEVEFTYDLKDFGVVL